MYTYKRHICIKQKFVLKLIHVKTKKKNYIKNLKRKHKLIFRFMIKHQRLVPSFS